MESGIVQFGCNSIETLITLRVYILLAGIGLSLALLRPWLGLIAAGLGSALAVRRYASRDRTRDQRVKATNHERYQRWFRPPLKWAFRLAVFTLAVLALQISTHPALAVPESSSVLAQP